MSTPEHGQVESRIESRSSVKLTRNAKGDCQLEVKVYEGYDPGEFAAAKAEAITAYRELEREFYGTRAAA